MSGRYRSLCVVDPLVALASGTGQTVRLIPPAYVKPYVKRQKTDATDARPLRGGHESHMRLCQRRPPSSRAAWSCTDAPSVHPSTDSGDQCNRPIFAEFGIVAPVGRHGVEELLDVVADPNDTRVPEIARACLSAFGAQFTGSRSRYWSSTAHQGGTIQRDEHEAEKAPASVRCWRLLRSLPLLIRSPPIRAQLLGVDRDCAETALEWRQKQARQYKQTR